MNVEKIIQLAELLENLPPTEEFLMLTWGNDTSGQVQSSELPRFECGTPACIAGWYARTELSLETFQAGWHWGDVGDELGLTTEQGIALFTPPDVRHLTAQDPVGAAQVLRHLAKTGEVDWRKYDDYEDCVIAEAERERR